MSVLEKKGPYIPAAHKKYNLLPKSRKNGKEVLIYPAELPEIDRILREAENEAEQKQETNTRTRKGSKEDICFYKPLILPFQETSSTLYYKKLQSYADKYHSIVPDLSYTLEKLMQAMKEMNDKSNWSVLKYVGNQYDAFSSKESPYLTKGRYYYWPASSKYPIYQGVIDNAEQFPYIYPCASDAWELVEDPTGMAKKALARTCKAMQEWYLGKNEDASSVNCLDESKAMVEKEIHPVSALWNEEDEDIWRGSSTSEIEVTCPRCKEKSTLWIWNTINAQRNPKEAKMFIEDSLNNFECPNCGYFTFLPFPHIFIDPKQRLFFQLSSNDDSNIDESPFENPDQRFKEKIIHRIVPDVVALKEKVLIFNEGLDDRGIEVLKLGIIGQARLQGLLAEKEEPRCFLIEINKKKHILCFRILKEDDSFLSEMDIGAYEHFEEDIKKHPKLAKDTPVVNYAWAQKAADFIFDSQ